MKRSKFLKNLSMKAVKTKLVLFLTLALLSGQAVAQQFYPVRVQPTVVFPSVFLNDYTTPENFRVLVSLNDVNETNYTTVLKVRFRSDDYELNSINGITVTLNGGETYMLDQQELSSLFALNNLTITNNGDGGSQTTLPEGVYTVSFSAFDGTTTTIPVSNSLTDFTIAPVLQNDPPLLNQPSNGEEIDVQFAGQNIMFSWTPRNVAVSPTRPIKYTLKLVQVVPVDRNPYEAIQTGTFVVNNQPFDGIEYPMFIFDQSNFELLPGSVYAWQVDAYEEATVDGVLGKSTLRFKNGGSSEVYTFKVKENCPEVIIQNPPVLETDDVTGKDLIALNWTPDGLHQQFEIRYRESGTILPWNVVQQPEPTLKLSEADLQRGLTYEYTIAPRCNSWQAAQYGGEFSLEKKDCEAPTPILIATNDATVLSLNWEATEFATAYKVTYEHDTDPLKKGVKDIEGGLTAVSLDPIIDGNYDIRIDAICGSLIDEGESMSLAAGETDVVGECPLPSPIEFLGLRSDEVNADELDADVSWAFLPVHESYVLTWWHRDSVNQEQSNVLSDPELTIPNILDDQLYKYSIEFTCTGGKKVTSPEGGFRIDGSASGGGVNTGTADCFPPFVLSAEPRDIDEGRFEWNKVTEAEEYQLYYWLFPDGEHEQFTTTASLATAKELIEGGTYKFKVRARCGGEYSIFSDEASLDLTLEPSGSCNKVAGFSVRKTTETEAQLHWPFPGDHEPEEVSGYTIRYKAESQVWKDSYTLDLGEMIQLKMDHLNGTQDTMRYTIEQLEAGTKYDFEITAKCGNSTAKSNDPIVGETLPQQERDCGSDDQCDRSSSTPKGALSVDDTVLIADYSMKILTVTPDSKGQDLWKGTALAEAPMIGYSEAIQFTVTFDSLFLNEANCVTGGNMDVGIELQVLPQEIRDKIKQVENYTEQAIDAAQTAVDQAQGYMNQMEEILETVGEPVDLSVYSHLTPQEMLQVGQEIYNTAMSIYNNYHTAGGISNVSISQVMTDIKTGAALIKQAMQLGAAAVDLGKAIVILKEVIQELIAERNANKQQLEDDFNTAKSELETLLGINTTITDFEEDPNIVFLEQEQGPSVTRSTNLSEDGETHTKLNNFYDKMVKLNSLRIDMVYLNDKIKDVNIQNFGQTLINEGLSVLDEIRNKDVQGTEKDQIKQEVKTKILLKIQEFYEEIYNGTK